MLQSSDRHLRAIQPLRCAAGVDAVVLSSVGWAGSGGLVQGAAQLALL
jgi:hypothetical protein